MNDRTGNNYDYMSQPSISPSRVDKLMDDKKSRHTRQKSLASTFISTNTKSNIVGGLRLKQDNMFAEPSLMERKLAKNGSMITPTG
jgi:hypothetical protein